MSTHIRQMANRLAAATLTCIVVTLAFAQPAAAHKAGHRPAVTSHYYRAYDRHFDRQADRQHGRRYVFPRWLQRDRDFQRWFFRNDYRFRRNASWVELYDLYRFEVRHWRRGHNRFRGRVYVAPEYFYRKRHW